MNKIHLVILLFAFGFPCFFSSGAEAQIILGGGRAHLDEAQKLMLEADAKTMSHDYKDAEQLYSQIIALNGNTIDAYLQRGIVRRELGDAAGTASDGRMTVSLADAALKNKPNDPSLYYKRGMGFRLLKNYDQAEQDIATGIRLGGSQEWKTDLQAIAMEKEEGR